MRFLSRLSYLLRRWHYGRRWQRWNTAQRGQKGEALAAAYLRTFGLAVICRNWRRGKHELDLVMRDGDVLVFVEVRTRPADASVPGFETLTAGKRQALRQGMEDYLRRVPRQPRTWRFDMVEVNHHDDGRLACAHYAGIRL
ncbi:MAG: hypothetical protein E1N59_2051 [Puniceicoccaceae bacterium 5H]|nr:MAG: hypothetical protein E1N59_2051 [Puniceicoccaceae bacterium 5H]